MESKTESELHNGVSHSSKESTRFSDDIVVELHLVKGEGDNNVNKNKTFGEVDLDGKSAKDAMEDVEAEEFFDVDIKINLDNKSGENKASKIKSRDVMVVNGSSSVQKSSTELKIKTEPSSNEAVVKIEGESKEDQNKDLGQKTLKSKNWGYFECKECVNTWFSRRLENVNKVRARINAIVYSVQNTSKKTTW